MTNSTPKSYTARKNAIRAAKVALGEDAIVNVDFIIIGDGKGGFQWTRDTKATSKAVVDIAAAIAHNPKGATAMAGEPVPAAAPIAVNVTLAGPVPAFTEPADVDPILEEIAAGTDIADAPEDDEAEAPATTEHDLGAEIAAVQADIDSGAFDKPVVTAAPTGKKAAAQAAAAAGIVPKAPDFSAKTHARYRKKLANLEALVAAGDVAALEAFPINPISSSPQAMNRYRNLAVVALKAKAVAHAA